MRHNLFRSWQMLMLWEVPEGQSLYHLFQQERNSLAHRCLPSRAKLHEHAQAPRHAMQCAIAWTHNFISRHTRESAEGERGVGALWKAYLSGFETQQTQMHHWQTAVSHNPCTLHILRKMLSL